MNLVLSLTEACNLRCKYCYYKKSHEDRCLVMSDEVLDAAIRVAFFRTLELHQKFFNVTFFGGEPLLRKDSIYKAVDLIKSLIQEHRTELAKDFRLQFAINTNGTLLNDEILEYLRREKFRVFISLDGPEHYHNIARRTINDGGSFEKIASFIPALVEMDSVVLSVVTHDHVATLAESVKWLFAQGFKQVTTSLDFDGKWTGEEFDALAEQYVELGDFWVERKKQSVADKSIFYYGTFQDKFKLGLQGKRFKNVTCHVFEGAIGVSANGNVFPCTRFITSKPNAPYCLGNVLDCVSSRDDLKMRDVHELPDVQSQRKDLNLPDVQSQRKNLKQPNNQCKISSDSLFNGPVAQDILRFLNNDKAECEGCAIRYRCHAHECACTSFYTTGSIDGVSAEVCTHERMLSAICDDLAEKFL